MNDLTRWNRAGLSRFRYVEGNAATHLEVLRRALADRFPGRWDALRAGVPEDLDSEPDGERIDRLLDQYRRERGDWGWEIGRALARVCHVLTEHLDAYANEGYLGTATQWDHVRRLVELLDYSPAPPASATAPLVLATKGVAGTVGTGFQVQATPPEGGAPVVFETLEDLEVDPLLDALRPAGWNRSPRTFSEDRPTGPLPPAGALPVRELQGVGPAYERWLDRLRRIETGDPAAGFRIQDFLRLEPRELSAAAFRVPERPRQAADLLRLRLQELKGKAEVLLGLSWSPEEVAPLLDRTLADVVRTPAAELARQASSSPRAMERIRDDLRLVEIVLDQPVFARVTVRDLVAGGGSATAPPEWPWIAPEKAGISAGDLGLVVRDPAEAAAVAVERVDPESRAVTLRDGPSQRPWHHWTHGETSLLVKAGFLRRPRLNGPGVVTFEASHDLGAGEVVAWRAGGTWRFARVEESDERAVRLGSGPRPVVGDDVLRTHSIERGRDGLLFPFDSQVAARPAAGGFLQLGEGDWEVVSGTPTGGEPVEGARYRKLRDTGELANVTEIHLALAGAAPVGRVAAAREAELVFDGKPGKLAGGQWVVADDGTRPWPLRIARVTEREDHFTVAFEGSAGGVRPVGDLPCREIQGVGPESEEILAEQGVRTVADLHRLETAGLARLQGISPTRRWELKTKADFLFGLAEDAEALAPVAALALPAVLDTGADELARRLSGSREAAEELQEYLRMCRACLDETAFRRLAVRDLLPAAPGRDDGGTAGAELPDRVVRLHGLFEHTLRPTGWDRNDTPLTGDRLVLDAAEVPRLLTRGRRVLLERETVATDGEASYSGAVVARVDEAEPEAVAVVLDLASPLVEADGFTLGNAVLRGNLVTAGHGEAKPEKVLGSGDAARSNQRFILEQEDVSFVADATQPSGVRADVTVRVAGRAWQQVANLRASGPADAHYAVRMTEDGHLAVEFGDGRHGRRLPTGGNNVRIGFRVGTGLAGNLAAGSLTKAARPHRLVKSVRQPLAASGGNDMEDVRSLKANAPASVLTLERAVSVSDLGHLAARQSSVWQARAFSLPTGLTRRESVEVVVVPPEGKPLGDLERTLREYLQAHTLPGVDVKVSAARMTPFDVTVTVRVKSAEHDPDQVVERVRASLLDAFYLQRRLLGQDLFLSEVYQVVEGVEGVESSTCTIGGGGLRRLDASDRQVFHLDPEASRIALRHEEWTL